MKNRFWGIALTGATLVFLTGGTALARGNNHVKSTNMDIVYPSRVGNGVELKPGNYKVEVSSTNPTEVMFYQNSKLVAQAPAKLVSEDTKSNVSELYYDNSGNQHVITQIDFQGWNQRVVLQSASDNPSTNTSSGN